MFLKPEIIYSTLFFKLTTSLELVQIEKCLSCCKALSNLGRMTPWSPLPLVDTRHFAPLSCYSCLTEILYIHSPLQAHVCFCALFYHQARRACINMQFTLPNCILAVCRDSLALSLCRCHSESHVRAVGLLLFLVCVCLTPWESECLELFVGSFSFLLCISHDNTCVVSWCNLSLLLAYVMSFFHTEL